MCRRTSTSSSIVSTALSVASACVRCIALHCEIRDKQTSFRMRLSFWLGASGSDARRCTRCDRPDKWPARLGSLMNGSESLVLGVRHIRAITGPHCVTRSLAHQLAMVKSQRWQCEMRNEMRNLCNQRLLPLRRPGIARCLCSSVVFDNTFHTSDIADKNTRKIVRFERRAHRACGDVRDCT